MTFIPSRRVSIKVPAKKYVTKVELRKLTVNDTNRVTYGSGYPAASDWNLWGDPLLFNDPSATKVYTELPGQS